MIVCDKCGQEAKTIETRYGIRSSCDPCQVWSWGGKPMVPKSTHDARKMAHAAFDVLWKNKIMSRSDAYSFLSKQMGIQKEFCHIAQFNEDQCKKVVSIALKYRHGV